MDRRGSVGPSLVVVTTLAGRRDATPRLDIAQARVARLRRHLVLVVRRPPRARPTRREAWAGDDPRPFEWRRLPTERIGFRGVLPRRWAVERTFSWLDQTRRLGKEYEHLCETSER